MNKEQLDKTLDLECCDLTDKVKQIKEKVQARG